MTRMAQEEVLKLAKEAIEACSGDNIEVLVPTLIQTLSSYGIPGGVIGGLMKLALQRQKEEQTRLARFCEIMEKLAQLEE